MSTLGDKIRELRIKMGYTQDELADKLNTKPQTIHKYEKGIVTNMPLDKIEAIAKALETTPEYLLGWKEKPTEKLSGLKNELLSIIDKLNDEQIKLLMKHAELMQETTLPNRQHNQK